jgi:hypothetical protein
MWRMKRSFKNSDWKSLEKFCEKAYKADAPYHLMKP